jgi:hypothetical protein
MLDKTHGPFGSVFVNDIPIAIFAVASALVGAKSLLIGSLDEGLTATGATDGCPCLGCFGDNVTALHDLSVKL